MGKYRSWRRIVATPYEFDAMFGRPHIDVYSIDIRTGDKHKFVSRINNLYSISPEGRHVVYLKADHYYVYNLCQFKI